MARRPISLITCLLAPFVILVAGVTFAGVQWAGTRPDPADESGRGPLPPGFSAEIGEHGKHAVWLHSHAVHQGQTYESSEKLPDGADVVVIEEISGKTLELSPLLGPPVFRRMGSDVAVAIGTFMPVRHGPVTVRGRGFPNPVVLSVAPVHLAESMGVLLSIVGILILSIFLSLVCLIVLLHRRKKMIEAEPEL